MGFSGRSGDSIRNGFLRALPPKAFSVLEPHLEPVELARRQRVFGAGAAADSVYFINRGLVSLVKPLADGRAVEVVAVGAEGAVCLSGVLGVEETILESVVHVPGVALKIKNGAFRSAVDGNSELKTMAMRYAAFSLDQMAQTAACNTVHSLEKRLCRWLLAAQDGAGADGFPLTHESLALMLGVRRPGVTLALAALHRANLISTRTGWITVEDRTGVEATACECYGSTRRRFQELIGG